MWTLIAEKQYPEFLQHYQQFYQYQEEIQLHKANGYIFLPRHFYNNYPHRALVKHIDKDFQRQTLNGIKFTGQLRPHQPPLIEPFIHRMLNKSQVCGGLKARPGAGKTVMGIKIACSTDSKTMIMIDNSKLAEQWIDTILKFTTATEDDIGWIKGNDMVLDRPFIIAMVQTLMSRVKRDIQHYYKEISKAGIGLGLLDEYHGTVTGPSYAMASLLLNTPDLIGLSATPYGINLAGLLMQNIVGPVLSEDSNYELIPKIVFVKYKTGLDEKVSKRMRFMSDLIRKRAVFNKEIVNSKRYFEVIEKITTHSLENDHRILTIVFNTEQVETISDYLSLHGINNRQFYGKKSFIDKENDKVVTATYKFTGRGFDYKELSCCIIASPITGRTSLEQVIGRIVREYQGKTPPVVYLLIPTDLDGIFLRDIPKLEQTISLIFTGKCQFETIDL